METKPVNREKITLLAAVNEVNTLFFETLARRLRNSAVTTVEQAMEFAKGERREIVELFKRLEELELGAFVIGRRGAQSRFEWWVRLTDVGQAYAGEIDEIEPASQEDLQEEVESFEDELLVRHEYRLRPELKISMDLPVNFTKREAERLANFIATLPYED